MEEQSVQSIPENLWWIIPGKLAGVRQPMPEELPVLEAAGVGAVVSVFHQPSNLDLYEQANIPHIWLPVEVDSVPSESQLQAFLDFVHGQNESSRAVAVHCSTGKHRTGTMLATYLIQNGSSYSEAMHALLNANPQIELETHHNYQSRKTQFFTILTFFDIDVHRYEG